MLIFNNLGGALSVKTCYAKFLNSSAVFLLVGIIAVGFLLKEQETPDLHAKVASAAYVEH